MTRDEEVLAVFGQGWYQPTQLVRMLNLDEKEGGGYQWVNKCPWCPVSAPRNGQKCSTVPRVSRDRMNRVLKRLVRQGRLTLHVLGKPFYERKSEETSPIS